MVEKWRSSQICGPPYPLKPAYHCFPSIFCVFNSSGSLFEKRLIYAILVRVSVLYPVNCSQPSLASFKWTLIKACKYKLHITLNCVPLKTHVLVIELISELFSLKEKRMKTKESKKKETRLCFVIGMNVLSLFLRDVS